MSDRLGVDVGKTFLPEDAGGEALDEASQSWSFPPGLQPQRDDEAAALTWLRDLP